MPPEFSRAERIDGIFLLDLPGPAEKQTTWDLYLRQYKLDQTQKRPVDNDSTGAKSNRVAAWRRCLICRLAASLDLPLMQAALNIVPVAVTTAEAVSKLSTWVSRRCLSA